MNNSRRLLRWLPEKFKLKNQTTVKTSEFSIHIAHISTTFNYHSGGINRLFKRLRAIRDNGFSVSLIVGRDYVPDPDWNMNGINIYRIPSLVKYIDPAKDINALFSLNRLLRRIRPEAVHTHLAKAGILGRWAAYLCRTPMILHTVHGPTFPRTLSLHKRLPYWLMEWTTGRITDYFVFVGDDIQSIYEKNGVCSLSNSIVIRTGRPDTEIDAIADMTSPELSALRLSLLKRDYRFMIVCVGRVVPSKQQDHAIKVLHGIRDKGIDAALVIVGEGYIQEEKGYSIVLKKAVADLGLTDCVYFTGHRDDALKIMVAADAVLHTSKYEGLPNIMVEAAIAARPVVAYNVSGANEVVVNGKTGFIVPQGDIESAVEKLTFLLGSPEKSKRMGILARELVSLEYRESTMIKKKLAFYREIFGDRFNAK